MNSTMLRIRIQNHKRFAQILQQGYSSSSGHPSLPSISVEIINEMPHSCGNVLGGMGAAAAGGDLSMAYTMPGSSFT